VRPPAQIYVQLRNSQGELVRAATASLVEGFRFADLPAGRYSIRLTGPGVYGERWDVWVREDLELEYRFPEELCRDRQCKPSLRHEGEPITICQ